MAFSPKSHKVAAMRALISRAFKIASNNNVFAKSYEVIRKIFILSGFHYQFIDLIKSKIVANIDTKKEIKDKKVSY